MSVNLGQVSPNEKGYGDSEGSGERLKSEYKLSMEAQKGSSGKRGEDHKIPDILIEQAVKKASKQLERKKIGERVVKEYIILGEGCDDDPRILNIVLIKREQAPMVLTVFTKDKSQYFREKRITMTQYQALLKELPQVDVRKA